MAKPVLQRSHCPIGITLDLIGDRWTLLIVRDLMFREFHEFREFLEAGEGIASNILSDRLKKLTAHQLIESIPHPSNKSKKLYYLTDRGTSLMPMMIEIVFWGIDHAADTQVPPHILEALRTDREGFMQQSLGVIKQWKSDNLPT